MAHDIMESKGQAAMFYAGKAPWHGLGTALPAEVTSEVAIKSAHLDWDVITQPLYVAAGSRRIQAPGVVGIVRKDLLASPECRVLGVVSRGYRIFQNREAFAFFDRLIGGSKAVYHTAGALGHGEKVWILAKLPGVIDVNDDQVEKFLLLATGHDGNTAVRIMPTPIRVVCQNTLNQALGLNRSALRIAHSHSLNEQMDAAAAALRQITLRYRQAEVTFRAMAKVKLDKEKLNVYLAGVFPLPPGRRKADDTPYIRRVLEDRGVSRLLFHEGVGHDQPGIRETLWAAYNGVTQYLDHHRGKVQQPQRLQSSWFGEGLRFKQRAYAIAEDMASRN